jgi:hypothetical protein
LAIPNLERRIAQTVAQATAALDFEVRRGAANSRASGAGRAGSGGLPACLMVSHWRLGLMEDEKSGWHLKQALAILVSLKQAGRLSPVDEPYIDQLRQTLRERGIEPA